MPLTAAELEALAAAPAAVSGDAGSVTERSADDIRKLLDDAKATTTEPNAQGGPKTAMRFVGMTRIKNPGAT